jgi:transmembrane sensor
MKHDPYSLTELIRNEEFIAWVMHPDELSDRKWQLFLEKNPGKQSTLDSAREYVILLAKDTGRDQPTQKQSDRMWSIVESHMHEHAPDTLQPEAPVFNVNGRKGWRWMRVAASAALILSIGSVSYWFYYNKATVTAEVSVQKEGISADTLHRFNDTEKPMMVLLQDGSSVVLQPGGRLSYAETLNSKRREVTLTGKAFFEIVKNKEKPFVVYSYGLATKVLGTSFMIDASSENRDIKVEVKTGTVSVFSISNLGKAKAAEVIDKPGLDGVTLTHNQKIAFSRKSGKIMSITEPIAIASEKDVSRQQFVFDETPVSEVFRILESAYNVRIDYDREKMGKCPLNATLIGQPFREKLEVICNALDAQFEIADNQITILGKGCK